ncbi:TonB-dependent receptor plug domain-containing protein [Maribacter sp. R77961]|uniref:TonB-dependent receptor plug domain-containing protein n=1 Tax=Maribacter sp. R77961 TaxID=3093871 RepID=UPI0037C77306
MKNVSLLLMIITLLIFNSCGSSKSKNTTKSELEQELNEKNRGAVSLLTRVIQLPGIVRRNGRPVINKTANSILASATEEPLYILDSYIVGSSFSSVNQLVDSFNVKTIEILSDAAAAEYGARAANGVIKITTYD